MEGGQGKENNCYLKALKNSGSRGSRTMTALVH